jgi:hypothetical protein
MYFMPDRNIFKKPKPTHIYMSHGDQWPPTTPVTTVTNRVEESSDIA